jgi:hypothetical protein
LDWSNFPSPSAVFLWVICPGIKLKAEF